MHHPQDAHVKISQDRHIKAKKCSEETAAIVLAALNDCESMSPRSKGEIIAELHDERFGHCPAKYLTQRGLIALGTKMKKKGTLHAQVERFFQKWELRFREVLGAGVQPPTEEHNTLTVKQNITHTDTSSRTSWVSMSGPLHVRQML